MKLLVLRPEPGATVTARRAEALGMRAVVASLFEVRPLAWHPPDAARFDAILMTSAKAACHGGPGLSRYTHMPVHAVGAATAAAAREAGFGEVTAGDAGAAALLARLATGPRLRLLHLCGEHHLQSDVAGIEVDAVPVYTSVALESIPAAAMSAARKGCIALIHSPRAAALFAKLVDAAVIARDGIEIVAISAAAADAAGGGWREVHAAPEPTDLAMLAIARVLCDKPGR